MSLKVDNKNCLSELFEALAHFPKTPIMIKSGDNVVDAHSIMGIFTIDTDFPFNLLFDMEPEEKIKNAISQFTLANAVSIT